MDSLFFSDGDRSQMCLLLQEGVERLGHAIHSFCFMTHHIHLAIQVSDISISRIMQNLALLVLETSNLLLEKLAGLLSRESSGLSKLAKRLEKKIIVFQHLQLR